MNRAIKHTNKMLVALDAAGRATAAIELGRFKAAHILRRDDAVGSTVFDRWRSRCTLCGVLDDSDAALLAVIGPLSQELWGGDVRSAEEFLDMWDRYELCDGETRVVPDWSGSWESRGAVVERAYWILRDNRDRFKRILKGCWRITS